MLLQLVADNTIEDAAATNTEASREGEERRWLPEHAGVTSRPHNRLKPLASATLACRDCGDHTIRQGSHMPQRWAASCW